jgi:hypothetical protein
MMTILYRPMVKEALVLITSGAIATLICGSVYAAPVSDTEQAAPTIAAAAPAQAPYQLAPMSKEEGRQMLLSMMHGQVPLASPTPVADR